MTQSKISTMAFASSGGMPTSGPQYSSHAPLHQQQQPSYPMNHPAGMHHPQMGRSMGGHSGSMRHSSRMGHAASMGMPPMPNQHMPPQHDPMLNQSSSHRPPPPQPPPPPPPQQYMNNPPPPQPAAPGNWQSERDTPHRREMIQQIVKLLKKDRNSSPESMSKLPQMAKHLEVSLYRNARSFEAYVDKNTLKHRLHQIAAEVSRKSRNQGEAPRDDRYRSARSDQSVNSFQSQNGRVYAPNMNGSSYPGQSGMRGGSTSPYISSSSNRGAAASGMINMQDELSNSMSNRSAGGYPSGMSQPLPPQPAPLPPQQQPAVPPPPQQQRSLSPSVGQNRNDPDWKMKIRHKQQRLLLLHHSAKCTSKGPCPVTPHCADMKRLWGHMEGCKDNHCRMPHCFSSRAILSHYRKCKDLACPACGPVRETVRKSQGTSRSGRMPPSNPLMGSTRPTAQIPPTQSLPMVAPSDSMSHMSMNSFGNQSMPQSRSSPVSHSGMPPPSKAEMPFSASSQFRSSNAQVPSSSAPQQMYRSDQPTVENRSISSMHAQPQVAPSVPSSSMPTQYPKESSVTMPASARPAGSSESEWQKIRHKQQRLLLLRHASRCQREAGTCPVTPHCANMKKLWDHIAHCKNQQCDVQHCLSSRYILSHYRRCKNPICPSCGPVRESIRKSAEREKKMQMMKQPNSSHQQSSNPSFDSGGDFREALGNFQGNGAMGDFNDHDNLQEVHEIGNGFPETEMDKSDDIPLHHGSDEIPESNVPSMSVPSPSLHSSSSPPEHFEPQQKRPRMEVSSSNVNERSSAPESVESAPVTVEKRATPELSSSSAVATNRSESSETNKNSDHSLLNSFTIELLNTHLGSLDRKLQLPPAKLKSKCLEVLKGLQTHQHGWVFNCPVDPVELGLPDYFDIIKKPMDLGTIQKRLESSNYHCIKDFEAHVHLTFDNAMTYNEEGSVVFGMAKELKAKFEIDMEKLMAQLEEEDPDYMFMKIRLRQQRLFLLHHSAKCTSKGPCPVTPHCADMKRLWGHMEGCKDNHCRMPHCFSSRAILSHYRKCKDPACLACGPVRETVRKSQGTSRSGRMPPSNPLMGSAVVGFLRTRLKLGRGLVSYLELEGTVKEMETIQHYVRGQPKAGNLLVNRKRKTRVEVPSLLSGGSTGGTTPRTPPKLTVEDGIDEITTSTNGLSLQNPIEFITANVVTTPPPPLPSRRLSQKGPWNTQPRDGNQRRYNHHQNHSSQRPHRHDGRCRLAQHDTRGCDDTKDPRRGSEDRTQRITVKAIQRGSGRNTESFDPVSTLVRPDLRVQVGSPRSTRFTKKLKHDDVVIVPELFGPENDWTLFHKLYEEIVNLQKHHVRGSDWISWHEGAHLIVKRPEESPTFQSVIHRLCKYFNIRKESIGTRFNYYKDSQDWKPFHHDSAAFNAERAQNQNITVGVSFGATRELGFLHATQSTNNANTHGQDDNNLKEEDRKIRVYFPQPNNGVFSFGRDVNIRWKHGINALPTTEQDGKGRISIILWGLAQDVIEEPHSPPMISTFIPGPHGASMPQSKKKKIRDNQNKHRDNSLQNTA